ncbi:MAG TPA: ribonuclease III [Candidatus Babeliales bacterium]|nr:ribonuclease III [Candidatus Babeliales bacterium]
MRALLRIASAARNSDLTLFEAAFAHQSYAREHGGGSNDRMEFLGDSVLGCIAAEWVFERFSDEPEGLLTLRRAAIVNDARLAITAKRLGFGALTRLGAGMRAAGGAENTSVLADAFEAFVAALYLRFGLEKARKFVLEQHIEQIDHSADALLDAKTRLQHYSQSHLAATPVYRETSRGTPQRPAFRSRVSVNGKILGRGEGSSKKAAQQAAAQAALEIIGDPRGDSERGGVEPSLRSEVPKAKAKRPSVARSATHSK